MENNIQLIKSNILQTFELLENLKINGIDNVAYMYHTIGLLKKSVELLDAELSKNSEVKN